MRSFLVACAVVLSAATHAVGLVQVRIVPAQTQIMPGEQTTVWIEVQTGQPGVGVYKVAGSVVASGDGGLQAHGLEFDQAYQAWSPYWPPAHGLPGANGGWDSFGSGQTGMMSVSRHGETWVPLAYYTVEGVAAGTVTLEFQSHVVASFETLDANWSTDWTATDATITVGTDDPWLPPTFDVFPSDSLVSSGTQGGPFSPDGITYTLSNDGTDPVMWSGSSSVSWLTVSPTEGWLPGSDSVTVSINSAAADLLPGEHTGTVTLESDFGMIEYRTVTLTVNARPGDINADGQIDALDVLVLANSWNKREGDVGYDPRCDLVADGSINALDLLTLANNWPW